LKEEEKKKKTVGWSAGKGVYVLWFLAAEEIKSEEEKGEI
jgi:hypothetical protein